MKKGFSLLLAILIVWNVFIYNTTNAAGVILSVDYSNFDWNQELKISWSINNKIDNLLLKKFSWDYYNQFNFLKTLNTKVFALWKKVSVKQKPIIDELKNYLSLKWDFIYKKSMVNDNEKVKKLDETFKKSIQTKWITMNKIIKNIDNENIVAISNQNNNFENLTKEDFIKIVDNLIDEVNINKYKTIDEILLEAKEITVEDFKKIKDILPSNIVMKDEFQDKNGRNNEIKWEVKGRETQWKLIEIINEKLENFWNLTKDKLNSEILLWMWDLYNVLENDDLINTYLSSIKPIWKIISGEKNIKAKEIKKGNVLKWYLISFENHMGHDADKNDILSYWDINFSNIWLIIFFDKNWDIKYYLDIPLNKIIYLWNNKWNKKQYIAIDLLDKKITFKSNSKNLKAGTISNINIVFEDNEKINNKERVYSLDDFKEILNKKVVKINIDWEDITNSELLEKWTILNTIK